MSEVLPGKEKHILRIVVLVLLTLGLSSSIYLANLYIEVHSYSGEPVESFCAISNGMNCVTVASSRYSTIFGIPVAVYGIEFFLAQIIIVAASFFRKTYWRSWLFLSNAAAILPCGALAWISAFHIQSFCLLCCVVYFVCISIATLICFAERRRFRRLISEGITTLYSWVAQYSLRRSVFLLLVGGLLTSQLIWAPAIFCAKPCEAVSGKTPVEFDGLMVDGFSIGPENAPVIIEEFTDMQCPFCGKAHGVIMELLRRHPGQVRLVHRDYPLDNTCNVHVPRPFHPNACTAARYARCAARQNRLPQLVEKMFENRHDLHEARILEYAETVEDINTSLLKSCAADPLVMKEIQKDIEEGHKLGITGTPTFFVNGNPTVGYHPLEWWEEKLKDRIK